jgi:RNA polymerase sigma factor (sigma-70 family)
MLELKELNYWQRFIRGDSDALSNLYLLFVDDLYSYGMKIYPDEFLVKDAVQEVFIALIEKKKRLSVSENVKAYIFKSLRNKIMEELRTRNRKKEIEKLLFNTSTEQTANNSEKIYIASEEEKNRHKIIQSALSQLTGHQREAIFLKFTNNCSYEQIAKIMGITVPSARTLLFRSIKQMKEFIFNDSSKMFHIYFL